MAAALMRQQRCSGDAFNKHGDDFAWQDRLQAAAATHSMLATKAILDF